MPIFKRQWAGQMVPGSIESREIVVQPPKVATAVHCKCEEQIVDIENGGRGGCIVGALAFLIPVGLVVGAGYAVMDLAATKGLLPPAWANLIGQTNQLFETIIGTLTQ